MRSSVLCCQTFCAVLSDLLCCAVLCCAVLCCAVLCCETFCAVLRELESCEILTGMTRPCCKTIGIWEHTCAGQADNQRQICQACLCMHLREQAPMLRRSGVCTTLSIAAVIAQRYSYRIVTVYYAIKKCRLLWHVNSTSAYCITS